MAGKHHANSCSCTCGGHPRRGSRRTRLGLTAAVLAVALGVGGTATFPATATAASDDTTAAVEPPDGIPSAPSPAPAADPAPPSDQADPTGTQAPAENATGSPATAPSAAEAAPEPAPTVPLPVEPATPAPAELPPTAPALPVWVFGDSIAYGTWLADPATQSWPAQLDTLLGAGQQVRDLGMGGQAVAFGAPGLPRMDDYVRSTLAATPADQLPHTIVFAGGVNDLIQSANDMYATRLAVFNLVGWIRATYPAINVFVATLTPLRSDHLWWPITLSERRDVYNAWARSMWGPLGMLLDTGDLLTAGATWGDVRYFVDTLHPNADGAAILAQGAHAVLAQHNAV